MSELMGVEIAGRPLASYAAAIGIFLCGIGAAQVLKLALLRRRGSEAAGPEGLARRIVRALVLPAVYLGSLYAAVAVLSPPGKAGRVVNAVFLATLVWLLVRFSTMTLSVVLDRYLERGGREDGQRRLKPLLTVANLALWLIGTLFLLDNIGFKISSVVAGLGIGGITVALASQAILGDLFSYFVILFDRPFELGEFIATDDVAGTIEAIGIKTTKIRAATGEQVVVSNSRLIGGKLHNYKRMERRLVIFPVRVAYGVDPGKLAAIPAILREAVTAQEDTDFGRAHLKELGESGLNYEVVYTVTNADYLRYMDIQEAINLRIVEAFGREGIEFALPTRAIRMGRDQAPGR
ncbi:MAG TPA: mechanosensitive ion channel family protein [Rectinemataceae bacterium]|nr:mechanosensitive ion channel family protein [Rectinemataceae bacterium]